MEVFGRIVYVFTYIWILLCIDISNSLTEGTNLTVCAGNKASFYSDLSNTSTVFIIVFKKGSNTIGTYQPEKGIIIYAEFKDRYSIVKERYGITLNINGTQVLDQGRFVCEITYITGPDVITEQHLIVKEKENSSLIMFEKKGYGSNTLIACSAIRGQVELKMPDNTTKTCSCCFIEKCSEDVCKTLTLDESDVDHSKMYEVNNGKIVKLLDAAIVVSVLCICIFCILVGIILLFGTKKTKNGDAICFCIRNKQKSQILSSGYMLNEEDMDDKSVIFSSGYISNKKDIDDKSVNCLTLTGETLPLALTYVDSSKVDVQVESDNRPSPRKKQYH